MERRYNLAEIEPIGPVLDAEEEDVQEHKANQVGLAAAEAVGSTPAVGVLAEEDENTNGSKESTPPGR
jgi:hypothetical protein